MTAGIVLTLIIIGLILIVIELFLIPGSTVVGLSGFIMACVGVYGSFEAFGTWGGVITFLVTGLLSLAGLVVAIKTKAWKIFALNSAIDEKVKTQNQSNLTVGQEGVTVSALRPEGKVAFNEIYFEVSSSTFVEVGQKVKITALNLNQIFVEQI